MDTADKLAYFAFFEGGGVNIACTDSKDVTILYFWLYDDLPWITEGSVAKIRAQALCTREFDSVIEVAAWLHDGGLMKKEHFDKIVDKLL
jgi:hypothetical protein